MRFSRVPQNAAHRSVDESRFHLRYLCLEGKCSGATSDLRIVTSHDMLWFLPWIVWLCSVLFVFQAIMCS